MAKLIKVHDNVYEELTSIKKDGETYSEVLARLLTLMRLLIKVIKTESL